MEAPLKAPPVGPGSGRRAGRTVTAAEKAQARDVSLRRIGRLFRPYRWQLSIVTAIIVAFLGRLNPIGILIAGLFLALTFIGGEQAQISIKLPLDLTRVCQGILLFYVLAADSLILYRVRFVTRAQPSRANP